MEVVGGRVVVEVDGAEELDAVEEDAGGCDVLGEVVGGLEVVVVEPEDVDDSVDPVDGLVVVVAVDAAVVVVVVVVAEDALAVVVVVVVVVAL